MRASKRRLADPTAFEPASLWTCTPYSRSVRPRTSTSAMIAMSPAGVLALTVTTGSSVSSPTMSKVISAGRQLIRVYTPLAYSLQWPPSDPPVVGKSQLTDHKW